VALERRIRREGAELVRRLQVREERRAEFVEARKQVRVLERLRERRLREYRLEVEREEQKTLDETGQRRRKEEAA
jgi:flagellar export protein FliJ